MEGKIMQERGTKEKEVECESGGYFSILSTEVLSKLQD